MGTKCKCFSLLLAFLACAISAAASVPAVINYQGRLTQPSGAPVADNTYSMLFSVYAAPTGGTALWSELNPSVAVKGGLFSAMLGSVENLTADLFDSPTRYFAVKVGSDPEMTPRQQIASVGYAFRAATVDDGAITAIKLAAGVATPAGAIMQFGGSSAPTGWLLCDGSAVSRAAYADLFAAVGAAYGAGDGSTTFNLPNLKDKFPMGKGATYTALGSTGGAATVDLSHTHTTGDHTLTITEMPSHTHPFAAFDTSVGTAAANRALGVQGVAGRDMVVLAAGGNGAHNHGPTGSALSGSQSVINPYQVVNYIIKY